MSLRARPLNSPPVTGVLVPSSSRFRTLSLGVGARLGPALLGTIILGAVGVARLGAGILGTALALFLGALLGPLVGPAIAYFPFGFFTGFRLSGFFFP